MKLKRCIILIIVVSFIMCIVISRQSKGFVFGDFTSLSEFNIGQSSSTIPPTGNSSIQYTSNTSQYEETAQVQMVQATLKPLVEEVLLHGRQINMQVTYEAGYLGSWVTQVFEMMKKEDLDLNTALDRVKDKIKFFGRMLNLIEKEHGRMLRILDSRDDKIIFEDIASGVWDKYKKPWWKGQLASLSMPGYLHNIQSNSLFLGLEYHFSNWPINYLVVNNIDDHEVSSDVKYRGRPTIKITNGVPMELKFGNFSPATWLRFKLKTDGGDNQSVKMIIKTKNVDKEGNPQKAEFVINGVGKKWKSVQIPLWGPYEVEWMKEKPIQQKTWREWLQSEWFWERLQEQNIEFKPEWDNITDWSNITSITFEFPEGVELYFSGGYGEGEIKTINPFDNSQVNDLRSYLINNGPILVEDKEGNSLIIHSIQWRHEMFQAWYVDPQQGPKTINVPFTSLVIDRLGIEPMREEELMYTELINCYYRIINPF